MRGALLPGLRHPKQNVRQITPSGLLSQTACLIQLARAFLSVDGLRPTPFLVPLLSHALGTPVFAPRTIPWPLVALFTAGYLAPYLLPATVGRLDSGLPLAATQAGAVGSALLLSSASAGFLLASRVERIGARTLARIGLTL